jgi:hypothetical protein
MKIFLMILFCCFISFKVAACDCPMPNFNIEFYSAKYVFSGEIIAKVYAKNKKQYTLTFSVDKHYKPGKHPQKIDFIKQSEGIYQGVITSCDESFKVGEKWTVFAHSKDDKLYFSSQCSNTFLGYPNLQQQQLLEKAANFKLGHFYHEPSKFFSYADTPKNLYKIIKNINPQDFDKNASSFLMIDIDRCGKTQNINIFRDTKADSLASKNGLFYPLNQPSITTLTPFEKATIEIGKMLLFESQIHIYTQEWVNSRRYYYVYFDDKHQLVWQEKRFNF